MLKADALKILGTQTAVAQAAGVSQPTVSNWGEVIPAAPAMRLSMAYPQIPLRMREDYPPRQRTEADP